MDTSVNTLLFCAVGFHSNNLAILGGEQPMAFQFLLDLAVDEEVVGDSNVLAVDNAHLVDLGGEPRQRGPEAGLFEEGEVSFLVARGDDKGWGEDVVDHGLQITWRCSVGGRFDECTILLREDVDINVVLAGEAEELLDLGVEVGLALKGFESNNLGVVGVVDVVVVAVIT